MCHEHKDTWRLQCVMRGCSFKFVTFCCLHISSNGSHLGEGVVRKAGVKLRKDVCIDRQQVREVGLVWRPSSIEGLVQGLQAQQEGARSPVAVRKLSR
jgi:hypothetical protein